MRPPRRELLKLALVVPLLAAGRAGAAPEVGIHIHLGLPVEPHLVAVGPGIQVVEGVPDEEVFYSAGWYWCRRQDGWYRSHSPREDFYRVHRGEVPPRLLRVPVGQYRGWHEGDRRGGEWREHERREHEQHERRDHEEHEHEHD